MILWRLFGGRLKFWPPKGHLRTRSVSKVAFGSSTGVFRGHFCATLVIWVPFWRPLDFEGGLKIDNF